jgi:hypothetical protein
MPRGSEHTETETADTRTPRRTPFNASRPGVDMFRNTQRTRETNLRQLEQMSSRDGNTNPPRSPSQIGEILQAYAEECSTNPLILEHDRQQMTDNMFHVLNGRRHNVQQDKLPETQQMIAAMESKANRLRDNRGKLTVDSLSGQPAFVIADTTHLQNFGSDQQYREASAEEVQTYRAGLEARRAELTDTKDMLERMEIRETLTLLDERYSRERSNARTQMRDRITR